MSSKTLKGAGHASVDRVGYACYMRVRTKAGKRDEFVKLVRDLRAAVLEHEQDTVFFEVLQGSTPDEFVFFEGFVDRAAQERHQRQPYHQAMSEAGYACLEGDPVIEFMEPAR